MNGKCKFAPFFLLLVKYMVDDEMPIKTNLKTFLDGRSCFPFANHKIYGIFLFPSFFICFLLISIFIFILYIFVFFFSFIQSNKMYLRLCKKLRNYTMFADANRLNFVSTKNWNDYGEKKKKIWKGNKVYE